MTCDKRLSIISYRREIKDTLSEALYDWNISQELEPIAGFIFYLADKYHEKLSHGEYVSSNQDNDTH